MLLFWIRGNRKILMVTDRLHLVVKVSYWPLFDHNSVYSSRQICTFVSAGRVRDCHVSIRNAVDTHDQRGDAARSVRRHQVLPLPGHFETLRPSGTLGSTLKVQSVLTSYHLQEYVVSLENYNCHCVYTHVWSSPRHCQAVFCLKKLPLKESLQDISGNGRGLKTFSWLCGW